MSKTRQGRILGMTLTQLTILGCLALAAIGTIFGGFILISSTGAPGGVSLLPPSAPTASAQTNLPAQAPPGLPSTIPAVISEGQVPADWVRYDSTTIEVWVPPQFQAVDAEIERQQRIEVYRNQGYGFLADRLANDTFDYRLWFNYPQRESVIYNTHILVKADILPTETLDEYIDQAYGADLQGFQAVDRQEVPVENLEAQRILLQADLNDLPISVAEYVITDGVNLWVVSCGTTSETFYSWLPEFDRIGRSFRLLY